MPATFRDRREAGGRLAETLSGLRGRNALVLALPRGGVPVAAEVARAVEGELDVLVARKLGAPRQPELGVGAIARGATYVDEDSLSLLGLTRADLAPIETRERAELARRERVYRGDRPPPAIRDRLVILVDDGVATGGTARAALRAIRREGPARLVFAAPVGPADALEALATEADEVILAETPESFGAVGFHYDDFAATTDEEVLALLATARSAERPQGGEVRVQAGDVELAGTLTTPPDALGLVVFAHGSGSSRFSPRNRFVAGILQARGLATLLLDLLTPEEEAVDVDTREHRFDLDLLAGRLAHATAWAASRPDLAHLPVAYFGSSTGGGAALIAAARAPETVRAVVSRGGRPDLAGAWLARVEAPVLLLVGGHDDFVLELNEMAHARLARSLLIVVPGASHLFEEPGTLEEAAGEAADFLAQTLAPGRPRREAHA